MVLGEGWFGDVEDVGGVGLRGQWRLLGLGSRRRNERRRGKTGRLNTTSQGRAAEAVGTERTAASVRLVRGTGRGAGRRGESHIQPRCLEQQEHSDAEHDDRLHAGDNITVLIDACKPFRAGSPSMGDLQDCGDSRGIENGAGARHFPRATMKRSRHQRPGKTSRVGVKSRRPVLPVPLLRTVDHLQENPPGFPGGDRDRPAPLRACRGARRRG